MSVSPRPLSDISLPAFSFDLLTIILRTYTTVKKPNELTVRGRHRGRARGKQQNDKQRTATKHATNADMEIQRG